MPFSWWKSAIPWPLNGSAGYSISLLKRWLGQDMDNCPKLIISLIPKLVKKQGSIRSTLLHLKVGIKPSKDLGHKLTLHQLELPSAEVVNRRRPKDPHKVEVYPTDPKDSPGRRTMLHPLIRATDLAESEGSPFNVAVWCTSELRQLQPIICRFEVALCSTCQLASLRPPDEVATLRIGVSKKPFASSAGTFVHPLPHCEDHRRQS